MHSIQIKKFFIQRKHEFSKKYQTALILGKAVQNLPLVKATFENQFEAHVPREKNLLFYVFVAYASEIDLATLGVSQTSKAPHK